MTSKKYVGHSIHVQAVDNGYLIAISTFGSTVSLVAKDEPELLALIGTIEFKPPVYHLDGPNYLSPPPTMPGLTSGGAPR